MQADVTKEADVQKIVRTAEDKFGRIDLFCSNAGISRGDPDIDNPGSPPNEHWELAMGVNVMAHVYAARYALPGMIARKSGYFLNTVSAAGLLSQIGSAVYSTTQACSDRLWRASGDCREGEWHRRFAAVPAGGGYADAGRGCGIAECRWRAGAG